MCRRTDTYIASELAVVEITLEDDQLRGLEVLVQLGGLVGQAPEAAAGGPVAVGAHDELALGVEGGPLAEEELEVLDLVGSQRLGGLALQLVLLGRGLEEDLGVGDGAEQAAEVGGQHVGDEPGDGLGPQDDLGGEARRQQVAGEDEVDVQLEARVVEDEVDAARLLPLGLGLLEQLVGLRQVVDEDVLLGGLAGLAALQLLDVLVGHVGEQGQVGGVAPQADLEDLGEEQLLGGLVLGGGLVGAHLADEVLVAGGELEDGAARGAERVHLLAVEDVVVLPVLGGGEEGADASSLGPRLVPAAQGGREKRGFAARLPIHVALGEEPGDVEPVRRVAALGELLVVGGDLVGEAIVDNGAVVFQYGWQIGDRERIRRTSARDRARPRT